MKGKMTEIRSWIFNKVHKEQADWEGGAAERQKPPVPATERRATSIDLQKGKGQSYCVVYASELDDRQKDKLTERHK